MIRNGEKKNDVKQLRRVERQAGSRHVVVHDHRIPRIEETEERLAVAVGPSSTLLASAESFITDWADS